MAHCRQILLSLTVLAVAVLAARAADRPLRSYDAVVIDKFSVDPELAKAGFPARFEDVLQKTIMARLLSERVFPQVFDRADSVEREYGEAVLLEGEVTDFSKGNRAARVAVGYGIGGAKLRITLVFRDFKTHEQVLRLEETGRYIGFGNITGGSSDKARAESTRKVVDKLMKKINAAR